jgi:hypothetical protein
MKTELHITRYRSSRNVPKRTLHLNEHKLIESLYLEREEREVRGVLLLFSGELILLTENTWSTFSETSRIEVPK